MIEKLLEARLRPIARRHRQIQVLKKLAGYWLAVAAAWLVLAYALRLTGFSIPRLSWIFVGCAAGGAVWVARRGAGSNELKAAAREIEREDPQLQSLLLAAADQHPDETGKLNYLQERVIAEALEHHRKSPWGQKVQTRLHWQWVANIACLFVLLCAFKSSSLPTAAQARARRSAASWIKGVEISPGDATVERNTMVAITARFGRNVPADVKLVTVISTGTNSMSLAKSLDDPLFGGTISSVKEDTLYYFEYGSEKSKEFKLRVFDYPELQRADANLTYPAYTKLTSKKIDDTRRITAVQGTTLDYVFQLNKPVRSARLLAKDKTSVALQSRTNQPNVLDFSVKLDSSKRYELELIDSDNRTNKVPADFAFDVTTNAVPSMKLASPRGDTRLSPLEEVVFEAEVADDFGLNNYGFGYQFGAGETKYVTLGGEAGANEKRSMKHLLPLEEMRLHADDLVSYFVWAEDYGPDGKIRRSASDIYFAEIRPFDEIFKEAPDQPDSSSSEEGQQQNKSQKLVELQKQIITATWNIARRETGAKPSANYSKDTEVVTDSQKKALMQADGMKEDIEDPRMKAFIDTATSEMEKAVSALKGAKTPEGLSTALTFEQSAYQALLKMQAREFSVSRRKRQQGGGGGEQQAHRQLDQLELKQSENRYENQRKASATKPEQKEQVENLNRLKELARRQQDVNEKLKELQTALQEAKTDAEKQKVRDQLKRLRDEQRELVQDVDKLQQQMNKSPDKTQMAEANRKLDQARQDAQQAAQNLDKEQVSKALASGSRSQQELQDIQQDLRKKTSGEFNEQMREMRNQARELANREEKIGSELESLNKTKQRTLSDGGKKDQLAKELSSQKSGLTNLFQQMQQVTEQAETAEPLLAKQLYDTLRKSNQQQTEKELDTASMLVNRSLLPQAGEFEKRAAKTIDELKSNVERAAESVLGDETEALKAARKEISELAANLEREIARGSRGTNNAGASGTGEKPTQVAKQEGQEKAGAGEQNQPGQGQQPGKQPGNQEGQGSGQGQKGQKQGQQGQGQGKGTGKQGKGGAQGNGGGQTPQPSEQQAQQDPRQQGPAQRNNGPNRLTGNQGSRGGDGRGGNRFFDGGGTGPTEQEEGPLTGNDFRNWADRLSEVEEVVESPDLRNEIARVQDRARAARSEFKREGRKPDWAVVRAQILGPLVEVGSRLDEELARRQSSEAMVPLDRDAVPAKYTELVRRYYENLGK